MDTTLTLEGYSNPSNSIFYLTSNRITYIPSNVNRDKDILISLGYKVNSNVKFTTEYNKPYLPMYFGLLINPNVTYKALAEKPDFDFNYTESSIGYTSSALNEELLLSDNKLSKDTTVRNNLILADEDKAYNPSIGIYNLSEGNGTNKFLESLKDRSALVLTTYASRSNTLFSDLIKDTVNSILDNTTDNLQPVDLAIFLKPINHSLYIPTERFNLQYVNYDSYLTYKEDKSITTIDTLSIVNAIDPDYIKSYNHVVTNNLVKPFRTPLRLNNSIDNLTFNTLELTDEELLDIDNSTTNLVDNVFKAYKEGKYRYSLEESKSVLFLSSRYGEITNTTYCPNIDYDLSLKDDLYLSIDYFEDIRGNSNVVRDMMHYLTLKKFFKPSKEKLNRYKYVFNTVSKDPKILDKIEVTEDMAKEVTRKYK